MSRRLFPILVTIAFATAAVSTLRAQNLQEVLQRGEEVFGKTCAAGYCHGSKGAVAAGAPRLAARGFTQAYIATTIARGVPDTSMPAFGTSLPAADRVAVSAYLATLNGVANPNIAGALAAPVAAAPQLSPEAARGRELFSDATRGFARCSTCHEVNSIGMSVTTPISTVPTNAAALKSLATPNVSSATVDGETMPILMVARRAQSVAFYDLTMAPPVLRTAAPAAIQTRDGSSWKHSSVIGGYSDAELTAILAYLRTVN
ncbi:MAG TPA: c-type cytochrome [Bryobacteraceae bacterium]|nr:c-type cytochrome [Bryobacteraceae bacterium]